MTRTGRYKLQYLVALAVLFLLCVLVIVRLDLGIRGTFLVALVLLLPGRVHGVLWRELYRGRRRLEANDLEGAISELRAFLARIDANPWLRRMWWLAWAVYTRDGKAMALSNIGAAQLNRGDLAAAESSFRAALAIDPEYPMPHANLSALYAAKGDAQLATVHAIRSRELGLSRGFSDRVIQRAGSYLARVEGSV